MKLASRMVPAKAGLALVIAFQMWCMMLRPLSHLVVARTAPFYATGGQSAQQKFWMGRHSPLTAPHLQGGAAIFMRDE
jgi:hypothetical protein